MIEDIKKFLKDNGIIIPAIGELPLDPIDCIAAIYAPSPAPNPVFDVYEQDIDFWSRYTDSRTAYDVLMDIRDQLHRKYAYNLTSHHVYFSYALSSIQDFDRDINRRKMYKLTIRLIYRPLN